MSSKNKKNSSSAIFFLGFLAFILLPVSVFLVSQRTPNSNALAEEVQQRIICPDKLRPMPVCPLQDENISSSNQIGWRGFWGIKKSTCHWQCFPQPSLFPKPSGSPKPLPSILPIPVPSVCPKNIICPMNCTLEVIANPDICGCECRLTR